MAPLIERFHARNPDLRVEFVMSDRYLDLAKGEADVALRSGDTDDELVGRKIADSVWAVYASRGYVERHGRPERVEDLSRHALISFDESMSGHRVAKWLAAVAPEGRIVARNNRRVPAEFLHSSPANGGAGGIRSKGPSDSYC